MLAQVRAALREGRDGPKLTAKVLARKLFCSESTLRRQLRRSGTSFIYERTLARAEVSLDLLSAGYPVGYVARCVGVTPDHLRLIVRSRYGWSPSQIKRVAILARGLADEPTNLRDYRKAKADDRLLQELVAELDSNHPLSGWARQLVLAGHHPERDTPQYQDQLRENERLAYLRRREEIEANAMASLSIEDLAEIDVPKLLREKRNAEMHMRYVANRKRRNRKRRRIEGTVQ